MSRCGCTPEEHAAAVRDRVRRLPEKERQEIERTALVRAMRAFTLAVKYAEEERKLWQN